MKAVVHYRKAPTKKTTNFNTVTYYRTDAACGVYSEVPHLGQGMKHTDKLEDVTCEKCLAAVAN